VPPESLDRIGRDALSRPVALGQPMPGQGVARLRLRFENGKRGLILRPGHQPGNQAGQHRAN
jgi:hypothetical protein